MRSEKLQAKVTRLRQIIAEAVPVEPTIGAPEAEAWRRYQRYLDNTVVPAADVGADARKVRSINRIAISYGWTTEVQRMLDDYNVDSISALRPHQLDAMHERFLHLEACYRDGCDPVDSPHAR